MLTCTRIPGGFICTSTPEHTVVDANGREWRFEFSRQLGPIVVNKNGSVAASQPQESSPFWAAFEAWRANGGAR